MTRNPDPPEHRRPTSPPSTAIYGWNVRHGTGHLRARAARPLDEMARRRDDVARQGPALARARAAPARCCGYAYANQFRPRPAYRFCLEDSVYLAADSAGRGFGRLLLAELLARCEAAGARQMLAVIGDSANAGSIGVHRALGFAPRRHDRSAAGWKFDRWLDVVVMQTAPRAGRRHGAGLTPPRRADRPAALAGRRDLARRCSAAASACIASTCTAGATPGPGCIPGRRWSAPTASGACASSASTTRAAALLVPLLGVDAGGDDAAGDRLRPDARRALGRALRRRVGRAAQRGWLTVLGVDRRARRRRVGRRWRRSPSPRSATSSARAADHVNSSRS